MAKTAPEPHAAFRLWLDALAFAAERHRDQRRKDAVASPYINHPIALACVLANEAGIVDAEVLAAALLHDTIEDTETTGDELRARFGERIAAIVEEVTDDKNLPKAERKRLQIVHAKELSHEAKLVKLADKTCNLRDMAVNPPADWPLTRRIEYFDWAKAVIDGLRGTNAVLEAMFDDAYSRKPAKGAVAGTVVTGVAGVDGCKAGWVVVARDRSGALSLGVHARASQVVAAVPDAVVAVDIPLGLVESGIREPDTLARKRLAGTRASSVFTAPTSAVLGTTTYAHARRLLGERGEQSISAQGYALVRSIRQWVDLLVADPTLMGRVYEVHPEVSFAEMQQGRGIAWSKKSPEGAAARRKLLAAHFGADALAALEAQPARGYARDDLYDALAALWSAERIRTGVARSLPAASSRAANGVPIAIWY